MRRYAQIVNKHSNLFKTVVNLDGMQKGTGCGTTQIEANGGPLCNASQPVARVLAHTVSFTGHGPSDWRTRAYRVLCAMRYKARPVCAEANFFLPKNDTLVGIMGATISINLQNALAIKSNLPEDENKTAGLVENAELTLHPDTRLEVCRHTSATLRSAPLPVW